MVSLKKLSLFEMEKHDEETRRLGETRDLEIRLEQHEVEADFFDLTACLKRKTKILLSSLYAQPPPWMLSSTRMKSQQ